MKKRAKLLTAILAVASLLVVTLLGTVLTACTNTTAEGTQNRWGQQAWGGFQKGGAISSETVSDLLGLTPEEIQAQRQEGKSLVEIAAAQGVSEDALMEAILAAPEEAIRQRVEAGTLAQEQADLMLERMEQRVRQAINQTGPGPTKDTAFSGRGQAGRGMGRDGIGYRGMPDDCECHDETEPGTGWHGEHSCE